MGNNKKKIPGTFSCLLSFMLLILFSSTILAYTPPVNSPIALNLHPRLLFIPQSYRVSNPDAQGITVQEMRSKLSSSSYTSLFQGFINEMDTEYGKDPASMSTLAGHHIDETFNAINFSFLYMMDPSQMSSFSFAHTKAEYGAKALEYANYIVAGVNANPVDWTDQYTHPYSQSFHESVTNLSLAIVADWLHADIPLSTRQLIIDAMVKLRTVVSGSVYILMSYKHFGHAQAGAGVLGLYGDNLDTSGTYYQDRMNELLNTLNDDWIRSFKDLTNLMYEGGANHPEGTSYDYMAFRNMLPFINVFSTALNENLFNDISYLKGHIYKDIFQIKPLPWDGGKWHYIASDDSGSAASLTLDWGRNDIWLHTMIHDLKGDEASVARWMKEKYYTRESMIRLRYFGVLHYFFKGYADDVVAKAPSELTTKLPLSKEVGMGQYIMRTGFENTADTLVSFFAPKWHEGGGHSHRDFASFKIFKHGNLAIDRQIAKSYSKNVMITQQSIFRNTIGVLKPGELTGAYNIMAYRGGFDGKARFVTDPAFQENGANHVGTVLAEDLNGTYYDYIDYDYSNSWDSSKVDYAERQFVYLRPAGGTDDEYVVVFDRINSVASNYEKYWLFHANFEPRLLKNNGGAILMATENYPNDPDTSGGRWVHKSASPVTDNTIEITNTYDIFHARLYNKTLLPESFQINKVGGPNHFWEDGLGRSIETPATLSEKEKNTVGSYTMQIQSTTGQQYDNFLNIMQFGDSNTLTQMTPTTRIDGNTMVGTLINDPTAPRVVMFSKDPRGTSISSATYTASYSASRTGKHLLVDVTSGLYDVYKAGTKIFTNIGVSSNGVLSFDAPGGGTFQVVRSGDLPDFPPAPPTGLKIN